MGVPNSIYFQEILFYTQQNQVILTIRIKISLKIEIYCSIIVVGILVVRDMFNPKAFVIPFFGI